MITARVIRTRFAELEVYIPFVLDRVKTTLLAFAEPRGYAVVARAKSLDSVSEKIETGRFTSWSVIDDFVACAIVIPTIADEAEALKFLQTAFTELRIVQRGSAKKAPDVFRFECTRFIGTLRRPEDVPEDEASYKIAFEVQVRTAFEHAWSVTTHGLTYKTGEVSWERLRLSAQLKATVEQLDMLVAGFADSSKFISRSSWPEIDAREETVKFFQGLFDNGDLPNELRPKDWTRFADNLNAVLRSVGSLRQDTPTQKVKKATEALTRVLATNTPVPLSLSLLQYVFSVLVTEGTIAAPFKDYTPVITEEMDTLYPALGAIRTRFDFAG